MRSEKILNGLSKIGDMLILNFIYVLSCIPIITIGASTTALYYTTLKMAENNMADRLCRMGGYSVGFPDSGRSQYAAWNRGGNWGSDRGGIHGNSRIVCVPVACKI